MSEHAVTIRSSDGTETEGVAEVTLYTTGARTGRMITFIVVGVLAGTMCLMVPGPHMLASPLPPIIGIWLGLRAKKTRAKVLHARGKCPACGEDVQLPGGTITDRPATVPCSKCRAMVEVGLASSIPCTSPST